MGTIVNTTILWNRYYPGSAAWVLLFFGVFCIWSPGAHALNSTSRVLCTGALFALLLVLCGVYDQLRWTNLSFALQWKPVGVRLLRFRPEYIGLVLLQKHGKASSLMTLPVVDSVVRFLLVLLTELVFGSALAQKLEYGELLRAWEMGVFSRSDSFVLAIWLMLAMYRVMLLVFLLRDFSKRVLREAGDSSAKSGNKMDCRHRTCGGGSGNNTAI